MELLSYTSLHTIYLFVFSIGLGLGLGVTVLRNTLFFFSAKDGKISRDEFVILEKSQVCIWIALLLYGFGGLGLFTLAYETMLTLGIFYASMAILLALLVSELIFSFYIVPHLQDKTKDHKSILGTPFLVGGVVSVVSWVFLLLHHIFFHSTVGYFLFMALYAVCISVGLFIVWLICRNFLHIKNDFIFKRAITVTLFFSLVFSVVWTLFPKNNTSVIIEKERSSEKSGATYTFDDVALHNNSEDCWLVIDNKVFNVTEALRLHPAMFKCGTDASVNYHKNHGQGIRDKMMKFYIGELREGTGITNVDFPFEKKEALKPYRELYVEEGSWNPRELMLVVEKDAEKLLIIDGTTHKAIARIHDVGFQPHTSVYTSDAKFMFIISRDGWLTKINLETLEPVTSVSVGKNSRGTAITDSDKYIAVGNYEPGNLVILDARTMQIVKEIPLKGEMNGKEIESRAGAVLEDGNRIVVALKDLNSVWVVDTDLENIPVSHKFPNIGGNVPTLHDAFLTADGKHYIVASQGSKTVWVLDLEIMKPVAEVTTGETPHTGSGAMWGDNIYVPALGEGLITVIDTKTWKPVKYIKTGGPGLFVRSYPKDPSYPYVWADTAFGDHKDEIYVIDARANEIVETIIPIKGESSWHPEFTLDGKFVYVVSQTANEVEVYDAYTFEIVKRITANTPSAVSNVGLRIEEPGL